MAANASDLILKIFVFGMILAQLFSMNKDHTPLGKQNDISKTIVGTYGTIFGAVGLFSSNAVITTVKYLYLEHRSLMVVCAALFVFAFLTPLYAISLVVPNEKYASAAEREQVLKKKIFVNRLSVLLFIAAVGLFFTLWLSETY